MSVLTLRERVWKQVFLYAGTVLLVASLTLPAVDYDPGRWLAGWRVALLSYYGVLVAWGVDLGGRWLACVMGATANTVILVVLARLYSGRTGSTWWLAVAASTLTILALPVLVNFTNEGLGGVSTGLNCG
jgi:hypothetical protein